MPKKFIKRLLPHPDKIRNHRHMQVFGKLLHDPNLWHLNRSSVPGAFAIGLFMAFVPIPLQMIPAAALAIYFRVNLPISVVLVWISNPITVPPLAIFFYKLGALILGVELLDFPDTLTWAWVKSELAIFWPPFLLGSFIVSVTSSVIGYFGIKGLWRLHVIRAWQRRKEKRRKKKQKTKTGSPQRHGERREKNN